MHCTSGLADATYPSPSCSGPRGELCKMASLVALPLPGMAADPGLPATRLTMSGLVPSRTAAGPVRSTVSAQHHVAAARRLTGPSLCPCDEPSTQGYDSLAVPICRRKIWSTGLLILRCHPKWTPLGVLQQPWRGNGMRMILVYIEWPLTREVRDFRGPPNCVRLAIVMRHSCRTRGQGNSRKQTTRRVPHERVPHERLSLVRISSVE